MNDNDIRQADIDSAAVYLLDNFRDPKASVDSWNRWADKAWGRDRAVYRRCAEIQAFRDELEAL